MATCISKNRWVNPSSSGSDGGSLEDASSGRSRISTAGNSVASSFSSLAGTKRISARKVRVSRS